MFPEYITPTNVFEIPLSLQKNKLIKISIVYLNNYENLLFKLAVWAIME